MILKFSDLKTLYSNSISQTLKLKKPPFKNSEVQQEFKGHVKLGFHLDECLLQEEYHTMT